MMDGVGCDVEVFEDDVDAPESGANAGRTREGMVIASFSSRSFPCPFHVRVKIGGGSGCRRL